MERKKNRSVSVSEYLTCKKMREALSTFPALGSISRRLSNLPQNSKTAAVDSYSPPSSPVIRTVHVQTKPTPTKPHHQDSSPPSEAIPINFDYTIPAPRISETAEKKDMNSLFDDFIRSTRGRITTVSNVGKGLDDTALADDKDTTNYKDHGTKKDSQKEHFSNFIHHSRRRSRTTSGIRRE